MHSFQRRFHAFRPRRRALGALASAVLVLLAPGCASGGGGSSSAVLVTLHDFKTGTRFELASKSHTDPVAYYSDERREAARKIQDDEIMEAFVDELERRGFEAHAQAGRAPSLGASEVVRWGLEVERGGTHEHWLVGTGSAPDVWKQFQTCRDMFLELYNATVSYQTVENASGKAYFDDRPRSRGSAR